MYDYSDWGYKFTVAGVMGAETDRPLRPPFPNLAFMRLVRSMAIECALKVVVGQSGKLASSASDSVRVWGIESIGDSPVDSLDDDCSSPGKAPVDAELKPEDSINFENMKADFYNTVFPALLKTLLVYNVSSASRLLKMKQEQKDVDVSSVPIVSSTYIARILQTHKSASVFSLVSPDTTDNAANSSKLGLSRSERLFRDAVSALDQSCIVDATGVSHRSTPRENEDKVENFRELSSTLLSALSTPTSSAQFQCPDQADLSQVLDADTGVDIMKTSAFKASGGSGKGREPVQHHIDIESSSNSTLTGAIQYRLKCSAGTTHCRIRAGPSLNTAEVGDVVNFSIVEICGAMGDFYRLADGRGFVKMSVENTLSWERVEQTVAKRTSQLSVEFLDQLLLNELDDFIGWGCYRFLSKLLPDIAGISSFLHNLSDRQNVGLIHLLVKLAGLGKLRPSKPVPNRQADGKVDVMKSTPLLAALKKMVNMSGASRGRELVAGPVSPLMLTMIEVASGLFARKSSMNSQLSTGREKESAAAAPSVAKPVVIESEHEYDNNTDQIQHVDLPGAQGIEITFDEDCSTEVWQFLEVLNRSSL